MKHVRFKLCKKTEPICPVCEVSMVFENNEYDENNIWGLADSEHDYGWFWCPECQKKWLIEDYDEAELQKEEQTRKDEGGLFGVPPKEKKWKWWGK